MSPDLIATLEQAAALIELDEHEIVWAVEQFGRCDSDTHTVLPCDDGVHYIVRPR